MILTAPLLAAAAIALLAASPAGATTLAPWSLEDFVANAHSAVTATVTAIDVRWNDDHTQIHSYVTLHVDEVVAGARVPDALVLDQLGGRVGNQLSVLEGAPVYHKGERVFVFVEKVNDTCRTLGFYQGKYLLEIDPNTGREVYVQRVPAEGASIAADGAFKEPEGAVYGRNELIERVRQIAASH
jgi:hypothetical protein